MSRVVGRKGNVLFETKYIKQFKKEQNRRISRLVAVKVKVVSDYKFGWGGDQTFKQCSEIRDEGKFGRGRRSVDVDNCVRRS